MSSIVNTLVDPTRRVPLAGRFDAEAATLLAGPADHSTRSGSPRSGAGLPLLNRTRSGDELPCQVHDPDLWFADTPAELEQAKALCRSCPAHLACLTGALERHEPAGVWGGQILDKGEILTHKRPRGRPRTGSARPERQPYDPQTASLAPNACDVEGAA